MAKIKREKVTDKEMLFLKVAHLEEEMEQTKQKFLKLEIALGMQGLVV